MRFKLTPLFKAIVLGLSLDASAVFASPESGEIVAGEAAINREDSRRLNISQSSNKAIINWQTFNIAADESVNITTPTASAITLNRVTGQSVSDIEGQLHSTGQVWLINPNGILFGKQASVNTSGLLASTLNITNDNFIKGDYQFTQDNNNSAKIINHGQLNSDQGYVAMLAPQIENTGIVSAHLGTVAMAAGTKATVTFEGNQLLNIEVPQGASVPMYDEDGNPVAALSNTGTLEANGGNVLMTAESVNTLLDQSINLSGIIKADTVEQAEGKIILSAKGNIIVDNATLSAQGLNANEHGGDVKIIGQNVALTNHTSINASGTAGGGDMRIGKDARDINGNEADITYIDSTTSLNANATQSGNGGFIETSGKYIDVIGANVNTSAAYGNDGMWLIDPFNVTISNSPSSGTSFSNGVFTPTATSNISVDDLKAALANGNVEITTGALGSDQGNITVSNDITWSSGNSLTLNALNSIILNAALIGTSDGTTSGTPNATINLTAQQGSITDNGGVGFIVAATTNLIAGTTTEDTNSYIDLQNSENQFNTITATAYGAQGITLINGRPAGITFADINAYGDVSISSTGLVVQQEFTTLDSHGGNVILKTRDTGGVIYQKGTIRTEGGNVLLNFEYTPDDTNQLSQGGPAGINTEDADGNYGLVEVRSNQQANNMRVTLEGTGNNFQRLALENMTDSSMNTKLIVANRSNLAIGLFSAISKEIPDFFSYLTIDTSSLNGSITHLTSASDLTSEAIKVTQAANINAGTGNITLNAANNDFSNQAVNLTGGTIQITDNNAAGLILGDIVSSGDLTVTASGNITQADGTKIDMSSGTAASNSTSFNIAADKTGSITLTNNNNFNQSTVSAGGAGLLTEFSVFDGSSSGLYLGNVNAGDSTHTATITAIAQSGFNQVADTTVTSNGGDVIFKTITGGTNFNQSGAINTGGGGMLFEFNYSGTVTQNTTGNIDTSDGTGNYGLVEVRSDEYGYSMEGNFNNANNTNNFQQLAFENIAGHAMEVNLIANVNNALAFGLFYDTAPTEGTDTFSKININTSAANGAVIKLNEAGAYTAEALINSSNPVMINAGTGNITLNDASNDFGNQQMDLTGGAIQITDANNTGLKLGAISSAALTATAAKALTVNDAITASGNVSLEANSVATNMGALTINGGINAGTNSVLLMNNSTAIGSTTNAISLTGGTLSTGTLNLATISGRINQSGGNIIASGTTTLSNTGRDVSLGSTTNNFSTVTSSGLLGSVTLVDANALILGSLSASNLNVTSGAAGSVNGALTQSGSLALTGTSSFTNSSSSTTAGWKDITLTNSNNNFGNQSVSFNTGGSVSILDTNTTGLIFGNTVVGKNLTATTTAGYIHQSSGTTLNVTGLTALDAGTHDIDLSNDNTFGNTITLGHTDVMAGEITLKNMSDINIAQVDNNTNTLLSNLTLDATGSISQNNALKIDNIASLTATGVINLDNADNEFSMLSVNGGNNVAINSKQAFVLLDSTITGSFDLTLAHGLIQNGTLAVDGITTINSSSTEAGDIISLSNRDNEIGTIGVTGSNVYITNSKALNLGQIDVDNLVINAAGDINLANQNVSVNVSGAADITAQSEDEQHNITNYDITLNGDDVTFNQLGLTGKNIAILNKNALVLGTTWDGSVVDVNASGTLNVATTTGGITQTADTKIVTNGASTFITLANTGSRDITLNNADNDFGTQTLTLDTSGSASIADTNTGGLKFGNISIGSNLIASTKGAITQTTNSTANVTGITTLTAGSNIDDIDSYIKLDNVGNNFGTLNAIAYGIDGIKLVDVNGMTLNNVLSYASNSTIDVDTARSLLLTGNITAPNLNLTVTATEPTNGYIQQTTGTITTTNSSSFEAYGTRVVSNQGLPDAYIAIDLLQNNNSNNQFNALSMISHYEGASAQANGKGNTTVSGTTNDGLFNVGINSGNLTTVNSGINSGLGNLFLSINGTGNIAINSNLTSTNLVQLSGGAGNITQQVGTTISGPVGISTLANATLNNSGALSLSAINANTLNVTASGNISQAGASPINVTGASAFDAGTNTISLGNVNQFGGTVTLGHTGVTAGAISINSGGTEIRVAQVDNNANTKLSNLSLNSTGSINQVGALNITGTAQLAAVGAITLNNANNDFDILQIDHALYASIFDKNALQLGDTHVTNTLYLTTGGDITQATNAAFNVGGLVMNSDTHDITLDNAENSINFLGITQSGNASITSVADTTTFVQDSIVNGDLTLHVKDLSQQGSNLSVSGTTTIAADETASANILLNHADNNLNKVVITSGRDVTLNNSDDLDLGGINIEGNLSVGSEAGNITQSGELNVINGSTFATDDTHDITLTDPTNILGNFSITNARNVSLTNTADSIFHSGNIKGNLILNLSNDLHQNTEVSVGGSTTINAAGYDVMLGAINNFHDISVTGNHIMIVNGAPLQLNSITAAHDLTVSTIGDLTQTGTINVGGDVLLASGPDYDIMLDNLNNSIGGNLSLTIAKNANFAANNNINLVNADIENDLTINSHFHNITNSNGLSVGGASHFNADTGNVTLTQANQFIGTFNARANNLSLMNVANTHFGDLNVEGNLEASLFGNVSQAANTTLNVIGQTTINAQSNDIDLTQGNNTFTQDIALTGNNIKLKQSNGNLTLNSVNAYGDVTVQVENGTLNINGTSPLILLRNGVSDKTVTLAANQINNQNTDPTSAIDLGDGSNNAWHIYLTNLDGNTFGNLASGNQAIWGTTYPSTISQSGNRYIFATPEQLILTPTSSPLSLTKLQGASITLPTPAVGADYELSGFVNASDYGNVFMQDNETNTSISGLSFTSLGAPRAANIGNYVISLAGNPIAATGYDVTYDNTLSFGTLAVEFNPNPLATTPVPAVVDPAVVMNDDTPNHTNTLQQAQRILAVQQLMQQDNCSINGGGLACSFILSNNTDFNSWLANSPLDALLNDTQKIDLKNQYDAAIKMTGKINLSVLINSQQGVMISSKIKSVK